jgi:hypothetical protein
MNIHKNISIQETHRDSASSQTAEGAWQASIRSDIMAASFPPFAQKWQVCIKTDHTLPWLLFGKRVMSQPTRDCGMTHANPIGDGHLTQAELT